MVNREGTLQSVVPASITRECLCVVYRGHALISISCAPLEVGFGDCAGARLGQSFGHLLLLLHSQVAERFVQLALEVLVAGRLVGAKVAPRLEPRLTAGWAAVRVDWPASSRCCR